MKESLEIRETFNVVTSVIYKAWLNSEQHSKMTGGDAECSNAPGAKFTAWDGYIWGKNVSLSPHKEIVQTWRTKEFADDDEDSLVTIYLKESDGGTELRLVHTNIPEGQTQYEQGWVEHYFKPMKEYFG